MERSQIDLSEATVSTRAWTPDQGEWTYEDWLKLPEDGYRYEVINGELFMSPSPRARRENSIGKTGSEYISENARCITDNPGITVLRKSSENPQTLLRIISLRVP